ncbi:MAG TPA: ArsC family (seleno)protein [Planctomycetota bacterium]|nr:ArsC family (seleno)protein [Planctomycetota bacterium]
MSCTRSAALIASTGSTVRETVDAKKQRYGAKDLATLFKGAKRILVCKGTKVTELEAGKLDPAILLGPTGNLRAPTARIGTTWLVGFGEATWREGVR